MSRTLITPISHKSSSITVLCRTYSKNVPFKTNSFGIYLPQFEKISGTSQLSKINESVNEKPSKILRTPSPVSGNSTSSFDTPIRHTRTFTMPKLTNPSYSLMNPAGDKKPKVRRSLKRALTTLR
ncbi:unnamed protein product [Blepharisma stoltei]|uniref:Uncharacterized protein n=1 Tax=Blepharisma stoltei TaxID=1481888 RepID=A0AAU9K0Z2_9CILI|nr:unnamed protein product [Blepharisma stoltei]